MEVILKGRVEEEVHPRKEGGEPGMGDLREATEGSKMEWFTVDVVANSHRGRGVGWGTGMRGERRDECRDSLLEMG